jgi:asparagine synthase (glutamine-hydrolysing)
MFERWDKIELRRPEPEADPLLAVHVDQLSDASANGRVLLTGHGADPALRVPARYAVDLVKHGEFGRLSAEVGRYIMQCRRLPRVRIGTHVRRWLGFAKSAADRTPSWLNATARSRPAATMETPPKVHPTRPHAYELLTSADWPSIFETYDPGVTGVPVEVRHPFFDRRLVEYLLAIPPMPWSFDKTIVRLAMRGSLPERVRRRPKTVAASDPIVALLQTPDARWVDHFEAVPALHRYVDRKRVPRVCGETDQNAVWTNVRPLCLNYWLKAQDVL